MIGLATATRRRSFRSLFRPATEIYDDISEGRQFHALYFSMLVFGCLIALLGLLLNSPAVIIGAMLISPLMGPILSCGLALNLADGTLAKKAGRNLGLSVLETVAIAALAAWLSPLKDATPEILARTNPNLMDLLVAFFSGAAGTLALCSRRSGLTIIPGVAIATAVMPPLATVGYGISTRQTAVATGALMLFITNLAAIIVSAHIIFAIVGVHPERRPVQQFESWWVRHRMTISWAVLVVLSIPLVKTLIRAADQGRARNEVRSTLARELNRPGVSRVDEVTVQVGRDAVAVEANLETASLVLPEDEKRVEGVLAQRLGRKVVLHLNQLQLAQAPKPSTPALAGNDYVAGGKIRPAAEEAKLTIDQMLQRAKQSASDELVPLLKALGIDEFETFSIGEEDKDTLAIKLNGTYVENPADANAWKVLAVAATQHLQTPVRIYATMTLPPSQTYWIRYRRSAVRPVSSELTTAKRRLAEWKEKGLEYGFVVPSGSDEKLSAKRLEYLQQRLGTGKPLLPLPQKPGEASTEAVGMAAIQFIDVSATPTPAASSARN